MSNKKIKLSFDQNKKLEIISIIGLIIFAIISSFVTNFIFKNNSSGRISIFVDGKKITKINGQIIDINTPGEYVIGDLKGDYNIIEIKDNNVHCIDANCPDKICVKHGFINEDLDNDLIICAPHKLVISLK